MSSDSGMEDNLSFNDNRSYPPAQQAWDMYEQAKFKVDKALGSSGRSLVERARSIIEDRRRRYGDESLSFFSDVARMWEAYLTPRQHLTAEDVATMMILFKLVRHDLSREPQDDDLIDVIGYTAVRKDIEVQRGQA